MPAPSRWTAATHPSLYEINTWPWLARLSQASGSRLDLGGVPGEVWDRIAGLGFDAVWLMGVWTRSPAGIAIALENRGLRSSFSDALPDWRPEDVVGSPYCVRDYKVDPHLGGTDGLAAARDALARRGLGLVLDFVPNHVAPDHPWTSSQPEHFVTGGPGDLAADPASWVSVGDAVLANGRDPFFPAWPDVVQLDAFSADLRHAVVGLLRGVAGQCDAVRCDMAMLMMNETFARTWGDRVGPPPDAEYWPTVIDAVRACEPGFRFIAEAYWDLEWDLQQQGFDHCYDKRLYDRLVHDSGDHVRLHLQADLEYQDRLLRFVENHDEPRAASVFDPARQRAVTVTALTQTGARLVHDGQMEGARVHLPVFLGRFPDEPVDEDLLRFHESLLAALADPVFHRGTWAACERSGWPADDTYLDLVSWRWEGDDRWLVIVNLSPDVATGHVVVPWPDLRGHEVRLVDPTHDSAFTRSGDDLNDGLYVQLRPWDWHLLRLDEDLGGTGS